MTGTVDKLTADIQRGDDVKILIHDEILPNQKVMYSDTLNKFVSNTIIVQNMMKL